MVWLTAAEALELLNVRPQTLYANVSRGKIRARPDDDDTRRSLYHRDDVLRMARRANGRRKVEIVSSEAMQYGDPVLASAISTAANGKLLYRGHDATKLADTASLEHTAALLWQCDAAEAAALWPACAHHALRPSGRRQAWSPLSVGTTRHTAEPPADGRTAAGDDGAQESALAAGLLVLARRSAVDAPSLGRPLSELRAEAATVLASLVDAMTGDGLRNEAASMPGSQVDAAASDGLGADAADALISHRLASSWRAGQHEDLIRRALVLMADHELNASTFATRVAISTGASLAAGVLAGFTTLTGPLHGGAAKEFAQLIAQAQAGNADDAVRAWLASGRPLPAFGHPLYSDGDPRAKALLRQLPKMQPYEALAVAAEQQAGELPNIDYALSMLTAHCGLPQEAPFVLFAVGRCVGWLAHALEQVQAGRLIRPRARYTGPADIINAGIY
ncbi:citrate synthase family protein [Duganella radicis]|uniref:Citrate synthase n=1 Tax=Duganella radicis TaxID=551988 RepID=A0A6L6PID5_9BURK|nr:citrate synthase family protein [Duganella radicis]MTV38742.1 citrate synthase [Duganella radicis]